MLSTFDRSTVSTQIQEMSQGQPTRPQASDQEGIRYGHVFDVTGGLESKPIAPPDAATMRNAENQVLGGTPDACAAAVMQASADLNVRAGVVNPDQGNEMVDKEGAAVSKSRDVQGRVFVTEAIDDHKVEQDTPSEMQRIAPSLSPTPIGGDVGWTTPSPSTVDPAGITIGEALEAAAIYVGEKPIDPGDAAAIRTAEAKAAGHNVSELPSGLGATAQAAATFNARVADDYNKITISDVLSDAASRLPGDKPVTIEDADEVRGVELSRKPDSMTTPGGVADTMATAARVNRDDTP